MTADGTLIGADRLDGDGSLLWKNGFECLEWSFRPRDLKFSGEADGKGGNPFQLEALLPGPPYDRHETPNSDYRRQLPSRAGPSEAKGIWMPETEFLT